MTTLMFGSVQKFLSNAPYASPSRAPDNIPVRSCLVCPLTYPLLPAAFSRTAAPSCAGSSTRSATASLARLGTAPQVASYLPFGAGCQIRSRPVVDSSCLDSKMSMDMAGAGADLLPVIAEIFPPSGVLSGPDHCPGKNIDGPNEGVVGGPTTGIHHPALVEGSEAPIGSQAGIPDGAKNNVEPESKFLCLDFRKDRYCRFVIH